MAKEFVRVHVKGITPEDVIILWQEGKLFTKTNVGTMSAEDLLARCQQEALVYVSAINDFVTAEWRNHIKDVWEAIVCDKTFAPLLLMKQKQEMNRYFVTSIVYNMQVLGIYAPVDEVSMLKLHLTLEKVDRRNSIFKNWGKYALTNSLRRRLSHLIEETRRV